MKAILRTLRRNLFYRPRCELLEARLVLGEALLGWWFAWPDYSRVDPEIVERESWQWQADGLAVADVSALASRPCRIDFRAAASDAATMDVPPLTSEPLSEAAASMKAAAGFSQQPSPRGGADASLLWTAPRNSSITPRVTNSSIPPLQNFTNPTRQRGDTTVRAENYGQLPLTFEANHGQVDSQVDFITRAGSYTAFLTPTAAVFSIQNSESRIQNSEFEWSKPRLLGSGFGDSIPHLRTGGVNPLVSANDQGVDTPRSPNAPSGVAIHMQILNGNPHAQPIAQNRQPGIVNYFIGNDPNAWHTNIPTFGRIEYQDVYPGINLAYYSNNGQLEYDFIVSPGADPSQIRLNFAGAESLAINPEGNLVIHTSIGELVQQKPFTYQEIGTTRQEVSSGYTIHGTHVRFDVGTYDATRPLVVDPLVLGYSTYLGAGGFADYGHDLAVDYDGNAYLVGDTVTPNFPATPGAFDETYNGSIYDAFVAKLNEDGTALVYATFLGGADVDGARHITTDSDGNTFVTGGTWSTDFPTTPGAFDTALDGVNDGFVTKLNSTGTWLAYSTFIGGSVTDGTGDLAVDGSGNVFVEGSTSSPDFPVTPNAFDTTLNGHDAYILKLSADGSALGYATFLGGTDFDGSNRIFLDSNDNVFVAGATESTDFPTTSGAFDETYNGGDYDIFVCKLNPDASALDFSTYLGGSIHENADIFVDDRGSVYVAGYTTSPNFPVTPGAYDTILNNGPGDGFLAKFDNSGSRLIFSTLFGGTSNDGGTPVGVDGDGNVFVVGGTGSSNFPVTWDAYDKTFNGSDDTTIMKFNATGSALLYATFFGGTGSDLGYGNAMDADGSIYVGGTTTSGNLPTTAGAYKRRNRVGSDDGFMSKFAMV